MLSRFRDQYAELWKAIIRPPRDFYEIPDLGNTAFVLNNKEYLRTDFTLRNDRDMNILCSHFEPEKRVSDKLPCVVYLHGNCSSRLEAINALPTLLPLNITVFCFDFSGSGISQGDYVSLGWWEREDLATVLNFLREDRQVSSIGIWGRSMGAATALLHSDISGYIGGYVFDSPFSSLKRLAEELVSNYTTIKIPKFLFGSVMSLIKSSIQHRAYFDIYDLNPIDHVPNKYQPAMFIAARDDTFIRPQHSVDLYNAYGGDKRIVHVDGNHNSPRSKQVNINICIYRIINYFVYTNVMYKHINILLY
eukprot:GHVL01035614.1.p1 GENE.GHVL01035614.1~~GHVL01035614.1.p1  ORF type:complete len:306 (-),score=41.54 GHVL01035614.1:1503-2420(-)